MVLAARIQSAEHGSAHPVLLSLLCTQTTHAHSACLESLQHPRGVCCNGLTQDKPSRPYLFLGNSFDASSTN